MAASLKDKQRMLLDVSVTPVQKDALLTILKALEIEVEERQLSEDEEDEAFGIAMMEGIKEGIADDTQREEFESFLFGKGR
jgi:hypothetical protein